MTQRRNYREVRDRFTHIDAQLIESAFTTQPPTSRVTVRFYPWWEHPLYLQARAEGKTWGFCDTERGARDLTAFATNPLECHLSHRSEITDWEFCDDHPEAWRYQDEAEIFCNTDPDIPRLTESVLARNLPFVTRTVLSAYLPPSQWKAPFSLGHFPFTLYNVLHEELERLGVRLHLPRRPVQRQTPVVLLMDGDDYIIADDFELEVPEFEHRSEWFSPAK
jgi:hypothetical protein